jgi:hypothetical protein
MAAKVTPKTRGGGGSVWDSPLPSLAGYLAEMAE